MTPGSQVTPGLLVALGVTSLPHIDYQPGWGFLAHYRGDSVVLEISWKAPDAREPRGSIALHHEDRATIEEVQYYDQPVASWWVAFVKRAIWRCHEHEFDEWFRVNGVLVANPHPKQPRVEPPDGPRPSRTPRPQDLGRPDRWPRYHP